MRGRILTRTGTVLADNEPVYFVNFVKRDLNPAALLLDALEETLPAVRALLARPCALPNDLADGSALARQFQAMVDTEPGSEDAEDALDDWFDGEGVLLADEHLPAGMRSAADSAGWTIREPQWDPGACLHLVTQRHVGGASDDVHGLLPIYPRVPEAVSLWEARKRV